MSPTARPTPFLPEQQKILGAVCRLLQGQIGTLIDLLQQSNGRFVALLNILSQKGLVTADEYEAALAEVKAAVAVDTALSPELRVVEENLRRLLEGEQPEGESPSTSARP
jgi:hypothetical protein